MRESLLGHLRVVREVVANRNDALFLRFLPEGYSLIALDSVAPSLREDLLMAKVRLGTLITLYDDLADRPDLQDPGLLQELYRMPFERSPDRASGPFAGVVRDLWNQVLETLETLPNYPLLAKLFHFDVRQFYAANQYSELVTDLPELGCPTENRVYGPHNMGILMVATADLMASPGLRREELGMIRGFFFLAQRAARISNVLATFEREVREGDVTGELVSIAIAEGTLKIAEVRGAGARALSPRVEVFAEALREEQAELYRELARRAPRIRTFDAVKCLHGFRSVGVLHEAMRSVI